MGAETSRTKGRRCDRRWAPVTSSAEISPEQGQQRRRSSRSPAGHPGVPRHLLSGPHRCQGRDICLRPEAADDVTTRPRSSRGRRDFPAATEGAVPRLGPPPRPSQRRARGGPRRRPSRGRPRRLGERWLSGAGTRPSRSGSGSGSGSRRAAQQRAKRRHIRRLGARPTPCLVANERLLWVSEDAQRIGECRWELEGVPEWGE